MTHYLVFHQIVPEALFDYLMDDFVRACSVSQQGAILYEYAWLKCYKNLEQSLVKRTLMRGIVRPESFAVHADETFDDHRLLVVGTPPPETTPQARYIGLWFKSSDPTTLLRYFVSELPVDPQTSGDVLGEWMRDKSHRNFGPYCAANSSSPEGFVASIARLVGAKRETTTTTSTSRGVSEARNDVRKKLAKRVRNSDSGDDDTPDLPKTGRHATRPQETPRRREKSDKDTPAWVDQPDEIAQTIGSQLREVQRGKKSVLIINAEAADGLRTQVSTYLQFKILSSKELLTEIQGDYSYWGVAIPSGEWHRFQSLGFDVPGSANGNFSTVFSQFDDDEALTEWLSEVINVMQLVLKPTGSLGIRRI
jgi:hypothetical protein